jgi:septum formation protein
MSSGFWIYLASASPRRSGLLAQIGVEHRIRAANVDERRLPGETPGDYVERLAIAKAQALWARLAASERQPVLGADTVVAVGEEVLGKPADVSDGRRMLRLLSGRTHQVYTGVGLRHEGGCASRVSVSDVTFRALQPQEIEAYWSSGEPADKAGGYAIQGMAGVFIANIAGSYSGIVGLPLYETGELLQSVGWQVRG